MCGILYAVDLNGQPVNKTIINRYLYQKGRGQEGYGLYDRQEDNLVRHTKEKGIMGYLKRNPSSDILFHHRMPTSTINIKNACHPFSTGKMFKTNYILIHNGWITNDEQLFEEHLNEGIAYTSLQSDWTFNDSEALLWDMALYLEGKISQPHAHGAIAFIMIARNPKGDKLYFYRNSQNPLRYKHDGQVLQLASEGPGELVPENYLFTFDYNSRNLDFRQLKFDHYDYRGWESGDTYRGRYNQDAVDAAVKGAGVRYLPDGGHSGRHYTDESFASSVFNEAALNAETIEDNEVRADNEIRELSWPISMAGIRHLWKEIYNADGKTPNHRYQKAVRKYYNKVLEQVEGRYEDALDLMAKDEKVFTRYLGYKKKDKTIKKWTNRLEICKLAQSILTVHPFWNEVNGVDPNFFLSPEEQLELPA